MQSKVLTPTPTPPPAPILSKKMNETQSGCFQQESELGVITLHSKLGFPVTVDPSEVS